MISVGRDGSICEDMPTCERCHLTVISGVPVHQDFCPGYLGERDYIINVRSGDFQRLPCGCPIDSDCDSNHV